MTQKTKKKDSKQTIYELYPLHILTPHTSYVYANTDFYSYLLMIKDMRLIVFYELSLKPDKYYIIIKWNDHVNIGKKNVLFTRITYL